MKIQLLILGILLFTNLHSQSFKCGDPLVDARDNQIYNTVQIGNQCWLARNLDYGIIVSDFKQLDNQIPEKTCYENNPENCRIYGGLYTWDEAIGWGKTHNGQGICPDDWHIPTVSEWKELAGFLGEDSAGYKLKVTADQLPKWDGNNESGFSALPGGSGYSSFFLRKDSWGLFWASEENGNDRAWFAQLDNYWYPEPPKYHNIFLGNYYLKFNGMSVRCLKNR